MKNDHAYHAPVLLHEALEGLNIQSAGTYVDATFGGGGHSRAILERLGPQGRVFGWDQDPDAAAQVPDDPRFCLIPENFRHLQRFLRLHAALPVQGILADLGVSSHQIDTAARGFSTRFDAPLDMRMDTRAGVTAAQWLEQVSEEMLVQAFSRYGEVRNSKRLAASVVLARREAPLRTTGDLVRLADTLVVGQRNKYLAQVFQAIRMAVNDELGALEEFLVQAEQCLAPGGRLVVITYHSLEDRPVKQFLLHGRFDREPEKDFYGNPIRGMVPVGRKPITASDDELRANPRARSAKMRIAERLGATENQD
ncbi:MAG: 16S rRNA (cytosine(1402)-N(4))-methyltransferase RsmH [Bacteroidetes bacterium]|nr:16S rRNA (cytosine(1402)-N(4))-methyltransferase RsmH [Bacteroidota bacterium]